MISKALEEQFRMRVQKSVWIGLLLGGVLASQTAQGQENWTLQAPATKPAAQVYNAMAYDAGNQKLVYFGAEPKTWLWDGGNWTAYAPATSPSIRQGHAMAYDATNSRVVLFGGYDPTTGNLFSDTWIWNGDTNTWSNAAPANSPPPLFGAAMAFDAVLGQVILFGGSNGNDDTNETWAWNGTTWTRLLPGTSPSARQSHKMVYDAAHQRIILFGGAHFFSAFATFADTWSWNGATQNWTQLLPSISPPDRYNHAMAYDASQSQVVVFGGVANHNNDCASDTWAWNGTTWAQLNPATVPPCVEAIPMEYDAGVGQIVLPTTLSTNDTWYFGTSTTTAVTINVPSGVSFSFNGATYIGTRTINVAPGTYALGVSSPQSAGSGTQLAFQAWSDGGAQAHAITVGAAAVNIT